MRFYCRKKAFIYFREYIESIIREKDEIILFDDDEKIAIQDDNITNIFLSFIPLINNFELVYKNNNIINLFYLNTEQATRENVQDFVNANLYNLQKLKEKYPNINIEIADYSNQNIKLFLEKKIIDVKHIHHIPYQFNEKENNKLKKFIKKSIYDVAYCGTDSQYRFNILGQIGNKNINICVSRGFFDDRDAEIGKSKMLLNIHFEKNYNIYESIRCDRWIFAGHLVLSESSFDDSLIDLKDCIVMCKSEDLPSYAEKINKKYDIYKKLYINNKTNIRNKVIQDRKNLYDEFRNKYN